MKFYMIHLMPYANLDLDYDKKHNSAWVTLPNTYFDPKNGPALRTSLDSTASVATSITRTRMG